MFSSAAAMLLAVFIVSAEGDASDARVRAMITGGWEIGAYAAAQEHITALAPQHEKGQIGLAICLTQMRHNLHEDAKKSLAALAEKSPDPLIQAALAWEEAAHHDHAAAFERFDRAATSSARRSEEIDAIVLQALGSYLAFCERDSLSFNDQAVFLGESPPSRRSRPRGSTSSR